MTDLLTSMCARLYGQRAAKDRAARARSRYQRGCRVSQTVIQAYRFALNPTTRQAADLLRHAGAARVAYNWGLARVKANLAQREAERSYGLTGEELTPPLSWTLYALRKDWNAAKHDRRSAPKKAYNTGPGPARPCVEELGRLQARQAQSPRVGFPRFKSKRKSMPSVRFTTGTIRVEPDRKHVTLPRLGTLKTHETTRKLQRRLADGRARPSSRARTSGRWTARSPDGVAMFTRVNGLP